MKKKKNTIILVCIAVIVITLLIIASAMNKVKLYDDEHTTGNTSGNLLNGGLFCEADDKIYFANPYDEGMLYVMDTNLENVKKVLDDNVSYLNVAGKYIFYTKRNDKKNIDSDFFMTLNTTGLYRCNLKGHRIAQLYNDPTQVVCLYGNNVYYQHYDQKDGLLLYSAKIDGSKDTKLNDDACAPYAVSDNTIYYAGYRNDHAIHSLKTDGTGDTILYNGNCTSVTKQGDYLYFMDMSDNYSLKRIPVNGGTPETLISERLATYNVNENNGIIYCQIDNGTSNGLYEFNTETYSLTLLAAGDYNYLHLTNDYLFYQTYDQSKLYILNLASGTSAEWDWKKTKSK